ncbi:MAG: T9SS type A sorting domain-containing protein, partial [Bacteroidota bacterium]
GDCINYTDLSTGTVQSYIWTFQGGTPVNSSDQNPTNVCYNVAGSFNTTLTVTNSACTNSNTHVGYINVYQPAIPVITANGDTLLSTPALTYQWYEVTTGAIGAGIFQFYVATTSGNYYVCITDAFGCSACSDTVHVDQEGVHENDLNNSFSVYPNPAKDNIVISNSGSISPSTMRIEDATGRLVKEASLVLHNGNATVSIGDLAKGSYMLQILDDKKKIIFSTPVIKQ